MNIGIWLVLDRALEDGGILENGAVEAVVAAVGVCWHGGGLMIISLFRVAFRMQRSSKPVCKCHSQLLAALRGVRY